MTFEKILSLKKKTFLSSRVSTNAKEKVTKYVFCHGRFTWCWSFVSIVTLPRNWGDWMDHQKRLNCFWLKYLVKNSFVSILSRTHILILREAKPNCAYQESFNNLFNIIWKISLSWTTKVAQHQRNVDGKRF